MGPLGKAPVLVSGVGARSIAPPAGLAGDAAGPPYDPRWIPWIFAAKTTAAALIALAIAFAFNLDQPKWALLTVFIVAQPQSAFVLAKSFYRIVGTVVGAGVTLILVAYFAQERTLFLGALAAWVFLCTFASKRLNNLAAYGFVLAGYTGAIVGIPGALDSSNAFYLAVARVTEISIGVMATAAISHVVLPLRVGGTLRRTIAATRAELAGYAVALLGGADSGPLRTKLLARVLEIGNLRAAAVFEDTEIRDLAGTLRQLDAATLAVIDIAYLLERAFERRVGAETESGLDETLRKAVAAITLWRDGRISAAALREALIQASAGLPLGSALYREPALTDEDVIKQASLLGRLREFFTAIAAYADAVEAFASNRAMPVPRLAASPRNDQIESLWAGARAATALIVTSVFWLLTEWPNGATTAVLATVFTCLFASREQASRIATLFAVVCALAMVPFFIIVEVLLPDAGGFTAFAVVVGAVIFGCALLMGRPKTAGLGFLLGLDFAASSELQNRMVFDAIGFVNQTIAFAIAAAVTAVLFAVLAPDTLEAARRRFARDARGAFERIFGHARPIALAEFEMAIGASLDRLRRAVPPGKREEDIVTIEAGLALLGIGRELIRLRDSGQPVSAANAAGREIVRSLAVAKRPMFQRARQIAQSAAAACLAELRDGKLGVAESRAAARELVAFAAVQDDLARAAIIAARVKLTGVSAHAA